MSYINKPEASELIGDTVLGQFITLTGDEAASARLLLAKLLGNADARLVPPEVAAEIGDDLRTLARGVYISRKRRAEHFGPALFSEYAWDMLLVLYIYGDRGERLSVSRLAEFSDAPLTTAIRWLDYLESQRLIVRLQCPTDRRKFFVNLTDKGRTTLENYFRHVRNNGIFADAH